MLVSILFFYFNHGYYSSFKEDIALKMDSINFSELLLESMLSFYALAGEVARKRTNKRHRQLSCHGMA
jgi:CPA1 family monovalent cation:H+ antiporter